MEKDHSNEVIRAVRAKTPFLFKTDWKADYESTDDSTQNEDEAAVDMEIHGEGDEDEDDFSDVVNYDSNLTKSFFMNFKDAMSEEILDAFSGTPPPQGTPPSETSPPPSKPSTYKQTNAGSEVFKTFVLEDAIKLQFKLKYTRREQKHLCRRERTFTTSHRFSQGDAGLTHGDSP